MAGKKNNKKQQQSVNKGLHRALLSHFMSRSKVFQIFLFSKCFSATASVLALSVIELQFTPAANAATISAICFRKFSGGV